MWSNEFDLSVHVSADEWAYCQRRLTYLEALLLHLVREQENIQEWYDADELAALRLPGLGPTRAAISRKANAAKWRRRHEGRFILYHVTSLPARAFDALVARILDLPEMDAPRAVPDLPAVKVVSSLSQPVSAPPWVLPLMSLMRGEAKGNLGLAWEALPDHLPRGTILPSVDEAATILVELGLSEKIARWSEH